MSKHVNLDCRGLACPGPVLRTMEALDKDAPESLDIQVDDQAARENVSRLLSGKGYVVAVQETDGGMTLRATRGNKGGTADGVRADEPWDGDACAAAVSQALGKPAEQERIVAFLTAEAIGRGSDELGGKLMLNFLATLPELGKGLWRIVLVNGAVKLAAEGHPALEKLQALAEAGVGVLVCGTCLGFFELTEKKRVGETTNMLDVVTSLHLASKVIQI